MKTVNKHGKIINAATKVFAKKGFFTARISDIAKEAKVADGTIYLYFDNKFDILLSVLDEEIGKLTEQIRKAISDESDPEKMLAIFARTHLTAMKKNRNLAEVIQVELRQNDKLVREFRNTTFQSYLNIVSEIIRKGQQQGIYREDILPGIAKRAFFGALDEVARVWTASLETNYSLDDTVNQVVTIFLSGIISDTK